VIIIIVLEYHPFPFSLISSFSIRATLINGIRLQALITCSMPFLTGSPCPPFLPFVGLGVFKFPNFVKLCTHIVDVFIYIQKTKT